ncbi:MAG: hypothetical protein IJE03_01320, partial [Ruminiclostridium sp.]|nr:hypothetical protein [Ruminiclostridium sp.]
MKNEIDFSGVDFTEVVKTMEMARKAMGKTMELFAERIQEMGQTLSKISLAPIIAAVEAARNAIAQSLSTIEIPILTEEEKQQWIESHKQWGAIGWTYL